MTNCLFFFKQACATVGEVIEQVMIKIGLRAKCPGYALYQCLGDQYEQVLTDNEKVGDSLAYWERWHQEQLQLAANSINQNTNNLQHQLTNDSQTNSLIMSNVNYQNAQVAQQMNKLAQTQHYFVFKKHLFLDSYIDIRNDNVEKELLLHQLVHNIKMDKFPITDQEASMLCALKCQLELSDAMDSDISNSSSLSGSVCSGLNEANSLDTERAYVEILQKCLPPRLLEIITPEQIRVQHQAMKGMNRENAKDAFFNLIKSWPLWSSTLFEVSQKYATNWPRNLWLAVDQLGLHVLEVRSKNVLETCHYKNIVDYNPTINSLMIVSLGNNIGNNKPLKYIFQTTQVYISFR